MKNETPECELMRLRKEQSQTRQDEVFGGLSFTERAAYDVKKDRIHDLERELTQRPGGNIWSWIPSPDSSNSDRHS